MKRLTWYLSHLSPEKYSSAAIAYLAGLDEIEKTSPIVSRAIEQELEDQRTHLKMIASENYCSYAVQLAMGNFLTDKYAEGFARHRFYAGCDNVDTLEELAVEEAKKLFHAEAAYVQPHSGADANLVAFWSILTYRVQNPAVTKLGKRTLDELSAEELEQVRQLLVNQKVMGLSLNSGGHLTHGYRHNVSSKMMRAVSYDVDPSTELLDYHNIAAIARQEKPAILLAGYSAYPRKLNFATLKEIADEVGATLMVDMAHFSGLVAGKVFTGDFDPIPFADIVTSTTHKTLRGPRGGLVLCKKNYEEVVNKGCPLVLGGPLPHVIAAKAIAFQEANRSEFCTYAHNIVRNAQALAEALTSLGVRLVTGGTENHLLVADISSFGLTGRQGENALRQGRINANRNTVPFDPNGPWYTSGLRLGTPALTSLGMGPEQMRSIATWIVDLLRASRPSASSRAQIELDPAVQNKVEQQVLALLKQFPLYSQLPYREEYA